MRGNVFRGIVYGMTGSGEAPLRLGRRIGKEIHPMISYRTRSTALSAMLCHAEVPAAHCLNGMEAAIASPPHNVAGCSRRNMTASQAASGNTNSAANQNDVSGPKAVTKLKGNRTMGA